MRLALAAAVLLAACAGAADRSPPPAAGADVTAAADARPAASGHARATPHIPPTPKGAAWEDLAAAQAASAADGRPVILYFTFDGCVWCKRLEDDAFGDTTVGEKARGFHWVLADRDASPELKDRFDVSAYPTLLVLGPKDENVHRSQGYRKADELAVQLGDALRRSELCRAGKSWDEQTRRAASICDGAEVETFRAPSEDIPRGLAFVGDDLWIAQGETLRRLDAKGAIAAEHAMPELITGLTSDGKLLYALEYGWTAGAPIHVIDPATGARLRKVVTEANRVRKESGASGIAWQGGKLWVIEGMRGRLHAVDPATGAIERTVDTGASWLGGLAWDGDRFVAASRTHLVFLGGADMQVAGKVAINFPVRSIAAHAGRVYLMEQPQFGHDKDHKQVRVWPQETLVHVLRLRSRS